MRISGEQNNIHLYANNKLHLDWKRKDGVIKGIQKQIMNVQEQISKISENDKMSVEEKMNREKELKEQLEELNKQLMQRNMEIQKQEREKEMKEDSEKQAPKDENNNGIGADEMQNLISIGSSLNRVKTQSSMRIKLKGEARVLESEIKLDESRGVDTTDKREKLSDLNTKIDKITSRMSENLNQFNKAMKESTSTEKKAKQQVQEEENNKADKEDSSIRAIGTVPVASFLKN
ncbi:MAG: FlxA-like family protein [Syntrophomonadaceae bacterium]|nr:FlxA-like family protein [Syntrophomonadaceae bacterium]